MPTFQDFLDNLEQGAAGQTTAAPFQAHLQNQQGGPLNIPRDVQRSAGLRQARRQLPQRTGRSAGALPGLPGLSGPQGLQTAQQPTFTPAELERIADPRLTSGLQSARSQYESAQLQSQALGLDPSGEPPQGALNTLFRWLDLPRAVAFNTIRATFDPNMGFDEFLEALDEREGFGDLGPLVMQEDDSGIERVLKGAGAFIGDVALDPLTYLTLGATSVGKKLGSEAIQAAVSKRAGQFLAPDQVTRFADEVLTSRAGRAVGRTDLSDEAREALEAIGQRSPHSTDPFETGLQELGGMSASAFQARGATGFRQFWTAPQGTQIAPASKAFPEGLVAPGFGDAGEKLWKSLPVDMRGGLRIRIPFSHEENVRRAVMLAGGGGRFAEAAGLGRVVENAHRWRGLIRKSKGYQAMTRTFGGANGDLYGKMVADHFEGPGNELEGLTYSLYRSITRGQQEAQQARKGILQFGQTAGEKIRYTLNTAGDKSDVNEATTAFKGWVHNPEDFWRLDGAAQGLEVDELGQMWLDLPEGGRLLSKNEVLALQNAREYHDTYRDMFKQAVDAGVDVEALDNYLPLQLTRAKKEQLATRRVGGRGKGTVRGDDPRRRAEQFWELAADMDEDGVMRSRMVRLTPEQANAKARQRSLELDQEVDPVTWFEDDPIMMLERYSSAMGHIVSEARFGQFIRRNAGAVVEGDVEIADVLKTRRLGETQQLIDQARDKLQELPPEKQTEVIRGVISDVDQLRTMTHRLLNDPALTPAKQVEGVRDVIRGMDTFLDDLPSPQEGEKTLEQARNLFQKATRRAESATTGVPQTGPISDTFRDLGLERVRDVPEARPLPPEISGTYAPENIRLAINKFYRTAKDKNVATEMVDRWYRPYHSMFKITATIGRGPGFHIRNVIGGMWNNELIDVTGADYGQASRLVRARVSSARRARKLEAEDAVKRTGLSTREATSQPGFLEAVNRRSEELLESRLGKVRVSDDYSLYDVHRLMIEHEIDWRPKARSLGQIEGEALNQAEVDLPVGPVQRGMSRAARAVGRDVDPQQLRMRGAFSSQPTVLHPGTPEEELSIAQRGAESIANLWWIRFNAGAAEMSEAYLRGSAFIQGLKRYRDPEVAKTLPLATQFDYQDLSDFERNVLRGGLIPFYTWTRHNVPLQARALIQNPGKMNRLNLLLDNAEEAFGDDDEDALPEWMRDRFMFISRFKFDGNPLAFGIETPAQDLNEWFKVGPGASGRMLKTLSSAMNPAFSVPLQMATSTEFFTGARLDPEDERLAPWWYQRLPQSLAPTWTNNKGDIMGEARKIVGWPGAVPWLGQSEKILAVMGLSSQPQRGAQRQVSDTIRQLFPIITAGTHTPEGESGELFQRAERLRAEAKRYADPADLATVETLKKLGFPMEQISLILEQQRARRAEAEEG